MAEVRKSDATAICGKCGGILKIQKIEPLFAEPDMMQHTFVCESCGNTESFKFKKGGL